MAASRPTAGAPGILEGELPRHSRDSGERKEIDIYRRYSQWYGSAFFIMQKKEAIA